MHASDIHTDPFSQSLSQDRRFSLWSYRELEQPMSGWSSLYGSYEVEVGKCRRHVDPRPGGRATCQAVFRSCRLGSLLKPTRLVHGRLGVLGADRADHRAGGVRPGRARRPQRLGRWCGQQQQRADHGKPDCDRCLEVEPVHCHFTQLFYFMHRCSASQGGLRSLVCTRSGPLLRAKR